MDSLVGWSDELEALAVEKPEAGEQTTLTPAIGQGLDLSAIAALDAQFYQTGSNLWIVFEDGSIAVVEGYFESATEAADGTPRSVVLDGEVFTGEEFLTAFAIDDLPEEFAEGETGDSGPQQNGTSFDDPRTNDLGDQGPGIGLLDNTDLSRDGPAVNAEGGNQDTDPIIGATETGAVDEDDLVTDGTSIFTGSLAVDFGNDGDDVADGADLQDTPTGAGNRSIAFDAATVGLAIPLTSGGTALEFALSDGDTILTAYVGPGRTDDDRAFEVRLFDDGAGSYRFTLFQPLDHPDPSSEDDLGLTFGFTATDDDGDSAPGTFLVNVNDDLPKVGIGEGGPQSAVVDEDDLPSGNGDFAGGDDETSPVSGSNGVNGSVQPVLLVSQGSDGVEVTGNLAIAWGADDNDTADGGIPSTQDDPTVDGNRSVVFTGVAGEPGDSGSDDSTTASTVDPSRFLTATDSNGDRIALADLTSLGEPIQYIVENNGAVLRAVVSFGGDDGQSTGEEIPVFTVSLSDDGSGSYTFTLHRPLDHPTPDVPQNGETSASADDESTSSETIDLLNGQSDFLPEDDINLTFDFTAFDADGDGIGGQFTVLVDDDSPVQTGDGNHNVIVYEDDIAAITGVQGAGTDGSGPTVFNGQITKVDFGADGFRSLAFSGAFGVPNENSGSLTPGGLGLDSGLTSDGDAVHFRLSADGLTIEAFVPARGDELVFTAELNGSDRGYEVRLLGNIDHQPPNDANNRDDAQLINFDVRATDGDGDFIDVNLSIRLVDDAPVANDDSATTGEDMPVNISVLGNDDTGADDRAAITAVSTPANGTAVINNNGTTNDTTDDFITYTSDPNFSGGDSFTYTLTDADGDHVTATVDVTVYAVNDAPVLRGAGDLDAIDEDVQDADNTGTPVSGLTTSHVTDADDATAITPPEGTGRGIAVIAVDPAGTGHFEYSLNSGASWTAFPNSLSLANALLLNNGAFVRFIPQQDQQTTLSPPASGSFGFTPEPEITFHAWDEAPGSGTAGAMADITGRLGGTNAFSAASATSAISITSFTFAFTDTADTVDLNLLTTNDFTGTNYFDAFDGNDNVTLPDTTSPLFATYGGQTFRGGAGDDTLRGGDGDDMINWSVGDGRDVVDGGGNTAAGDTFQVTGDAGAEAFDIYSDAFLSDIANQATATALGYTPGDAEIVIARDGTVVAELTDIEEIIIDGEGGGDSFTTHGSFVGTSLSTSTLTFDGTSGNDTVDVGHSSTHRVVFHPGGGDDTLIGDRVQDLVDVTGRTVTGLEDLGGGQFRVTLDDGSTITFAGNARFVASADTPDETPVNLPPIVMDDSATTDEDSAISVSQLNGLLANDSDIDGGTLSITQIDGNPYTPGTQITLASGALLTVHADGSYTYDPNDQFESLNDGDVETDSFVYTLGDGQGGLTTGLVVLTVTGVNDTVAFANNKFLAPDGVSDDFFGLSVAVNADGVVVVGSSRDNVNGTQSGSAYVYVPDDAGGYQSPIKLTAPDGANGDRFGESVALNAEGVVVVGSYLDDVDGKGRDSGSVYVYVPDDAGGYQSPIKLTAPDGVDFDGLGLSVVVNADGVVVAGARGDDDSGSFSGAAYAFAPDGAGGYLPPVKLTAPDAAKEDNFGFDVAVNADGVVVVGSYLDDDNGDRSGSAYVYVPDGVGGYLPPVKLTAPDGANGDRFGYSVAVNADGVLVVGSILDEVNGRDSGSAFVYVPDGNGGYLSPVKLTAPDGADRDRFGVSVAVNADGVVVVGSHLDDDNGAQSGSAYVYVPDSNGGYLPPIKLTAPDGADGDRFGYSVAVNADGVVVVGSHLDDDSGENSGAAYLFRPDGAGNYVGPGGKIYGPGGADPIVLDLNGDGVDLSVSTVFDLDADGVAERIGWVAPDDGILVVDGDGSGAIEDGGEVFSEVFEGGSYANSLEALRTLDSNGDGVIDASDDRFGEIKVWRDADTDGITNEGELKTLAEHGITEIDLNAVPTNVDASGNTIFAEGSFTRAGGSTGSYVGVQFGRIVQQTLAQQASANAMGVLAGVAVVLLAFDDVEAADVESVEAVLPPHNGTLIIGEDFLVTYTAYEGLDGSEDLEIAVTRKDGAVETFDFALAIAPADGVDAADGDGSADVAARDTADVSDAAGAVAATGPAGGKRIYGGDGDDVLTGGDSDDIIWGGLGKDTLTGGAGKDTFIIGDLSDVDIITDYTDGEDKIDLTALLAGVTLTDSNKAEYVRVQGDTLQVDVDGGGDSFQDAATLDGVVAGQNVSILDDTGEVTAVELSITSS